MSFSRFLASTSISSGCSTVNTRPCTPKSVAAKTGKITVKKGAKAGAYTVKVKVTSKATANYKAVGRTVKVVLKVR